MDSTVSSTSVNVQPPDPQAVQDAVRLATDEFIAAMENAERQSAAWSHADRARPLVVASLRLFAHRFSPKKFT